MAERARARYSLNISLAKGWKASRVKGEEKARLGQSISFNDRERECFSRFWNEGEGFGDEDRCRGDARDFSVITMTEREV